jgi:hypothetical protein
VETRNPQPHKALLEGAAPRLIWLLELPRTRFERIEKPPVHAWTATPLMFPFRSLAETVVFVIADLCISSRRHGAARYCGAKQRNSASDEPTNHELHFTGVRCWSRLLVVLDNRTNKMELP